MSTSNKQDTFKMYYEKFVNSRKNNLELEVRFGTKGKRITKIDFDNVIQKLLSCGFENGRRIFVFTSHSNRVL